ncbi:hypothetical protein SDC9_204782 [bioreactor metagenome]|uniref:Uncharacterized protein n=1 Tax=bioreactor metagenome TaxID=1076179 RepID=A0A645J087_9ZZZZ
MREHIEIEFELLNSWFNGFNRFAEAPCRGIELGTVHADSWKNLRRGVNRIPGQRSEADLAERAASQVGGQSS